MTTFNDTEIKRRTASLLDQPVAPPPPRCRACDDAGVIYFVRASEKSARLYGRPTVETVARCLCLAGQSQPRGIPAIDKYFSGDALAAFFPDGLPTQVLLDHDEREARRLGLTKAMRSWTLSTFPDQGLPIQVAQAWLAKAASDRPDIMIFGKPGVGKTGLAVAVMRAIYERGASVLFVAAQDWLFALRQAVQTDATLEQDVYATVVHPYLLVLDDINARRLQSGHHHDVKLAPYYTEALQYLHMKRTGDQRPTIYTMNLSVEEFRRIVPAPLYDRLRHSAEWWELSGSSRRQSRVLPFSKQRRLPTE